MLQRLKQRIAAMRTIKTLCETAERHARATGEQAPGPEHFLLAALDLPDGMARRAFTRAGADPARLADAIAAQHRSALAAVGVDPALLDDDTPAGPPPRLFQAQGAMQAVMRELADLPRPTGTALTGAHVALVIAGHRHGTAARALRALGIDGDRLAAAAQAEIKDAQRRAS